MSHRSLFERLLLFYGARLPYHRGKAHLVNRLRRLCHSSLGESLEQRGGLWWRLNPADYTQQSLFWLGVRDSWEIFHLLRLASADSVFFDVGANIGYYTVVLAARLGPRCSVHAFEPNPHIFQRLRENISLNQLPNVFSYQLGLSDTAGRMGLLERPDNSGATYLVEGNDTEVTTLDQFCDSQQIARLDFMKIDVEGFEERLLAGGRRTLERFRPTLLIEINPPTLRRQASSAARVAHLLEQSGYDLFEIRRKQLVPLKHLPGGVDYVNVLCLHADRPGRGGVASAGRE